MKKSELGNLTCSLASALAVVGDAWSLLIIKELMLGNRRFEGIQAQTGMSSNSLAVRLKALEKHKIIRRQKYSSKPVRFEYGVTARGFDLWPALVALTSWGDKWINRGTPPLQYVHISCDHNASPGLVCHACSKPVDAAGVRPLMSPKMRSEREQRFNSAHPNRMASS